MSHTHMDERYSTALRAVLVDQVTAATPHPRRRPSRRIGAGVLAGAGVLGGIGVAAAGVLLLPGEDAVEDLTTPITATYTGSQTVDLGPAPQEATHVSVALRCIDAGTFTFDDGAGITCTATDTALRETTDYDLPLALGQETMAVDTDPGTRWEITTSYIERTNTDWAVNAKGDSYGVANEAGTPDLVAVIATNGARGYVYSAKLDPQPSFRSPEEALAWQESMAGQTVMIPVYDPDGETVIGQFQTGKW